MRSDDKLEVLKKILLTDEREFAEEITRKIEYLESHQKNLSERVEPILDDRLSSFVEEIPQNLGPTITEALKEEIKKSQDAVAEALFPIIGKMIKKYVQREIALLNDQINKRLSNTFAVKNWFRGKKARNKEAAAILRDAYRAKIEQVIVIEKGSGLVKANFAISETMDEDMLAGMLTAIKSFVEDAYKKQGLELERIDYELFTIHIQNFSNYYIAVALSGIYDNEVRSKLEDILLEFAQRMVSPEDLNNEQKFTKRLKEYFTNERI